MEDQGRCLENQAACSCAGIERATSYPGTEHNIDNGLHEGNLLVLVGVRDSSKKAHELVLLEVLITVVDSPSKAKQSRDPSSLVLHLELISWLCM